MWQPKVPEHLLDAYRELRVPLISIFLIIVLLAAFYIGDFFKGDWDSDIFGNLATEFAGVLITFLLLESVIRHRDQRQLAEHRKIALRNLSIPISRHVGTLFSMYKSTIEKFPDEEWKTTELCKFFNDDFFESIVHLDFSIKAPVYGDLSWGQYLASQFNEFSERLESAVDKYGGGLLPPDLDLIEQIVNSQYARYLISIGQTIPPANSSAMLLSSKHGGAVQYGTEADEKSFQDSLKNYHKLLISLTDRVNNVLEESGRKPIVVHAHWKTNVGPSIGSGRFRG